MAIKTNLFKNDLSKTVVTTVAAVLSDTHSKSAVFKHAVSASLDTTMAFHNIDIAVSDTKKYDIVSIEKLIIINSTEPIVVKFVDFGGNMITLEVDGCFFLNGSYEGGIEIYGKHEVPTRCSVIYS